METINRHYIDGFAKDFDILDSNIKNGPNGFAEIGYFILPRVSANLNVTYLYSCIKHNTINFWINEAGDTVSAYPAEFTFKNTLLARD